MPMKFLKKKSHGNNQIKNEKLSDKKRGKKQKRNEQINKLQKN